MRENAKLQLVNINACIKLVKICRFVPKILSRKEILAYIKSHKSGTNGKNDVYQAHGGSCQCECIHVYKI